VEVGRQGKGERCHWPLLQYLSTREVLCILLFGIRTRRGWSACWWRRAARGVAGAVAGLRPRGENIAYEVIAVCQAANPRLTTRGRTSRHSRTGHPAPAPD